MHIWTEGPQRLDECHSANVSVGGIHIDNQKDEQSLQSMESSKYFNLSQYSTLKAKDDTLLIVREDTKLKGWRRTKNRNNWTDQDSHGVYMNFNPSEFSQGLMHLKNQLPSPTLIKWKVISSVIQHLPEHKIYLLNKKLLGQDTEREHEGWEGSQKLI